ncbi:MAG: CDP-diacylglycerol--glycerol-3-phosphate 3-phosphatidyltransferase [Hydromonas sp.]|jgi:cardiolipin synthase|nr:CDP-diacylglycerol--glycerol-3-phosphate 3-phosphatidyltransferase [Hydromonas sp.]MBP6294222.1 CDP-diacylglycerol--glycerol-3-phosphate 3-phosphatidyltransferase [Hydromonas sp.]
MPFNIPILLTWGRVIAIPLLVAIYYAPFDNYAMVRDVLATVLFVGAAVTDWLDGYLARKWNQTSKFGAFLDPVADKLLVAACLIVLVHDQRVHGLIALIIIGREITISALREWMASIGARAAVAVNELGKWKTAVQMIALPMLLFNGVIVGINTRVVGTWLIYVAAALTVISMAVYLKGAYPTLREHS